MATCSKCGATIVWIDTPAGNHMPCDEGLHPYQIDPESKTVLVTSRGEVVHCQIDYTGHFPDGMGRVPHWATCPCGDYFRRRKTK